MCNHYSPKLSLYLLTTCAILFILFNIQNLRVPPSSLPSSVSPPPWPSLSLEWQKLVDSTSACLSKPDDSEDGVQAIRNKLELEALTERLRRSVTFVPLKDLRYADKALDGHTWFMSTMYDTHEEGEVVIYI